MSDSLQPHGALQAPLSVGFSRQEYWSGLPLFAGWLEEKRELEEEYSMRFILVNLYAEKDEWRADRESIDHISWLFGISFLLLSALDEWFSNPM